MIIGRDEVGRRSREGGGGGVERNTTSLRTLTFSTLVSTIDRLVWFCRTQPIRISSLSLSLYRSPLSLSPRLSVCLCLSVSFFSPVSLSLSPRLCLSLSLSLSVSVFLCFSLSLALSPALSVSLSPCPRLCLSPPPSLSLSDTTRLSLCAAERRHGGTGQHAGVRGQELVRGTHHTEPGGACGTGPVQLAGRGLRLFPHPRQLRYPAGGT